MGQGQESKTREEPSIQIQERGEIFFFYRPKVGKEEAHGVDDVQRLYLVLRPQSGERRLEEKQDPHSGKEQDGGGGHGSEQVDIEKQPLLRFIVMGRKSLPDPTKKSTPYWGFVDMVTTEIEHVKAALQGEEYETSRRGHRHLSAARAVGEGVYRILKHNPGKSKRMHTHLVYKLEYPVVEAEEETKKKEEPPQEALNIAREASFILQIKNPEQAGRQQFGGLRSKRKAAFPAHMQGQFGHQRYHPADPPDFLNYEGCEFLLISASDDIEEELGLDLKTEEEEEQSQSEEDDEECCSSDLVKMFGDDTAGGPSTRPLFRATWA